MRLFLFFCRSNELMARFVVFVGTNSGEEESLLCIDSERWSIDGVRWASKLWDKDRDELSAFANGFRVQWVDEGTLGRYGSQSHAFTRLSCIIFLLRGPGCVIDTARISRGCVRSWAPNGHVFTCPWPCSNFLESIAWATTSSFSQENRYPPDYSIRRRKRQRVKEERGAKPWNNTSALCEKVWNFKLRFAGLKILEFDLNLWTSFRFLISRVISGKVEHF